VRPLARDLSRFEVTFVYRPPAGARAVALTGTFNGWDKAGLAMTRQRDGTFRVSIEVPAGRTEYKFILDQDPEWRHDPANPLSRDDGYGGKNSILDL
jgi:1,4-alpha-glucan branching enzyme